MRLRSIQENVVNNARLFLNCLIHSARNRKERCEMHFKSFSCAALVHLVEHEKLMCIYSQFLQSYLNSLSFQLLSFQFNSTNSSFIYNPPPEILLKRYCQIQYFYVGKKPSTFSFFSTSLAFDNRRNEFF